MARRNQDFLRLPARQRSCQQWQLLVGFFWPSQGNMEQGGGEKGAWRPWEGWLAVSFGGVGSAVQSSERSRW